MNRMLALAALVLAAVAVTFAGHPPTAFHHGAYAFRGYYPGKVHPRWIPAATKFAGNPKYRIYYVL